MALATALILIQGGSVWLLEAAFFVLLVMLGTILPTSTALALEPLREHSGSASATLGFLSFLVGGICSPLVGMGDMAVSTAAVIAVCALLTLLIARGADTRTLACRPEATSRRLVLIPRTIIGRRRKTACRLFLR